MIWVGSIISDAASCWTTVQTVNSLWIETFSSIFILHKISKCAIVFLNSKSLIIAGETFEIINTFPLIYMRVSSGTIFTLNVVGVTLFIVTGGPESNFAICTLTVANISRKVSHQGCIHLWIFSNNLTCIGLTFEKYTGFASPCYVVPKNHRIRGLIAQHTFASLKAIAIRAIYTFTLDPIKIGSSLITLAITAKFILENTRRTYTLMLFFN